MKTFKPTIVCAMALAAVVIFSHSALAVTPYATLTWTGGANDDKFLSTGNWTAEPSGQSVNLAYTNNFRFIDVADGKTITISSDIKFVNNITVSNTTGAATTLKLTGSKNFRNFSEAVFDIASNCVLQLDCPASNPWVATYNGFVLRGGGTLIISKARESWGGYGDIYSSTLKIASGGGGGIASGICTIKLRLQDAGACIDLGCDAWFQIYSRAVGSKINLNGHCMRSIVCDGWQSTAFNSELSGNANSELVILGSRARTLTTDSLMNGTYQIRNSKLTLGKSSTEPRTIPSDSSVNMYSHGILELIGSQQIGLLKGQGMTAYVSVPEGETFTVGGSDATTSSIYDGRLSGKGDFVKKGANYTLTMCGDSSAFSGNTTVSEGTLELKRPTAFPDDYVAYWPFDGTAHNKDLISGIALERYPNADESMYSFDSGNGVFGDAANFSYLKGGSISNHVRTTVTTIESAWRRRIDSTNFTVSVWLKPTGDDRNGSGRFGTFFTFGNWPTVPPLSTKNNLCKLEYYRKGDVEKIRGYDANPEVTIPSAKTLADGKWHHIAYVHSAHRVSFWIDGELGGTWTNDTDVLNIQMGDNIQIGCKDRWGSSHGFDGGLDELIIANGLWDEARIKRETHRCRYATELEPLPMPAAAWTFDEGLTDEVSKIELVNWGSSTIKPETQAGAYGKCINVVNADRRLKLKDGSDYPFPTGRVPFTVSLRVSKYSAPEYTHVFSFGNTHTQNMFFAIGNINCRSVNYIDWNAVDASGLGTRGASIMLDDQCNVSDTLSELTWDHLVVTYDGSTVCAYRDGRLVKSSASVALNIATNQPFYMGYHPNHIEGTTKAGSYVDDFRVWTNCCLSADQVATLTRTLDGRGVIGQFTNSTVTVNSGATLKATGSGNAVKSLSGSGTLNIEHDSSLSVGSGTFSGAVAGAGQLTLTAGANLSQAAASQYTGVIEVKGGAATLNNTFANSEIVLNGGTATDAASDITIAEGATIAIDGNAPTTPKITTSGRLILPETLTITVSPKIITGEIIVATAGTVVMPSSTANWTLPEGFRVRNKDGQFRITTKFGTVFLLW